MKVYRLSIWFAVIAASLTVLRAVPSQDRPESRGRRIPFLGVATEPVSPQVAAHLDLQEGIGLLVADVVPNSPAAAALATNDILVKLNDQWLVHPRQLAVLVRLCKPGQEVNLEYVRKGASASAKVKLEEREWTPLPESDSPAIRRPGNPLLFQFPQGGRGFPRPDIQMFPDDGGIGADFWGDPQELAGPDGDAIVRSSTRSARRITENGVSVTLTETDGARELRIEDAEGKVLFEGAVNTDKEIEAIPPQYRDAYNRVARGGRPRGGGPVINRQRPLRGPAL